MVENTVKAPQHQVSDGTGVKYQFKKRKRKDLTNAMQIAVFSLTDAELDKELQKAVEEAIVEVIKEHKDNQALAYSVVKG